MRLAAGLIVAGAAEASQTAAPRWLRDATLTGFAFERDPDAPLDGRALLDSAFASPGRYVGELLRRLRQRGPDARRYLAFNPYYALSPRLLDGAIAAAYCAPLGSDAFVLLTGASDDGTPLPLAYAFSPLAADAAPPHHLGLLSSCDAAADERLLAASFGAGHRLALAHGRHEVTAAAHGFAPLSPALANAARRAAERLKRQAAADRGVLLRGERVAVVGYHAGDVLFWTQALALTPDSGVQALVTLEPYADIARWASRGLPTWTAALPVPYRPGSTVRDEHAHLWRCVTAHEAHDPEPRLWHLLRPFRDYRAPRHHLREAMAFALGGPGHGPRPPLPATIAEPRAPERGRIIVHFEGGWRLKELPRARRGPLLRRLQAAGYAPVILGAPEPSTPDVPAQPYRNLDDFRALAAGATAIVGTDSFPSHCAQLLGLPTVQLFGPTLPAHARGPASPRYRVLHELLPCVPCVDQNRCARDGGDRCHAHADDDAILTALAEIAPLDVNRQALA